MDMVQPVDHEVREWAVSAERDVPMAVAKVLAVVGSLWLIAPLVGVVAIVLGFRRRWCELATLLVAFALALLLHGSIKVLLERERPADPLVETGQWSFPSGHSVNAAVFAITLVMVLVPPERRRPVFLAGALLYAVVMAWSRVYLRAHWLTDVVAGGRIRRGGCAHGGRHRQPREPSELNDPGDARRSLHRLPTPSRTRRPSAGRL
jgi:undecaprenyl-diphosphatase